MAGLFYSSNILNISEIISVMLRPGTFMHIQTGFEYPAVFPLCYWLSLNSFDWWGEVPPLTDKKDP